VLAAGPVHSLLLMLCLDSSKFQRLELALPVVLFERPVVL